MAEASRQFDLTPAEVENWAEDGKRRMENALRAKPEGVRQQYERQLKELQEAYGEAMLELLRSKTSDSAVSRSKSWPLCWARTKPDGHDPAGTSRGRFQRVDGQVVLVGSV